MSFQEEGVLAVGSGPILLSLIESWYESGSSKLAVFVTSFQPTDMAALTKLAEDAQRSNPDVTLHIAAAAGGEVPDWRTIIRPFSFILYVSHCGDLEELRQLQHACIAERKPMLPAIVLKGIGMAGPLLHSDGNGSWESAWRRLHRTVFPRDGEPHCFSAAAAALLSNILVHEWHIAAAGAKEPNCVNQCFVLNPAALTGSWHPVTPHPLVSGYEPARPVELELTIGANDEPEDPEEWYAGFNRLTSQVTGVFHVWEECDLIQLPLAQCLVQAADPLSEGPAMLLPPLVRSGLTHEEARRESGLAGLEAYADRMIPLLFSGWSSSRHDEIGVGTGCSIAEAVGRGLTSCLSKTWGKRTVSDERAITRIHCTAVEDVRCRFYLQALKRIEGKPLIAVGEPLLGFPVVWVYSGSSWYGSVDLHFTLALRRSLQKALSQTEAVAPASIVCGQQETRTVTIADGEPLTYASLIQSAVQLLKQSHKRLQPFDLRNEFFLGTGPFVTYGVTIGEGASP
ncbi:hypothetical protein ACFQI7_23055 [Paenibacillus allorhizosphaerae]|uniref:Thiazole-containing bacteriocin maturation protein n=1 Tax=Paenibacillus allorhizosphaerae TaxID=2849866 RepID=A0ABN7TXK9_9BACL|nr:hypothetical protein [Paenibacillus allorhizosphaerae]CAG7654847.1 hypothetical protein PAECIP111802_05905 [Paenibacillus allorhizosphaerae]